MMVPALLPKTSLPLWPLASSHRGLGQLSALSRERAIPRLNLRTLGVSAGATFCLRNHDHANQAGAGLWKFSNLMKGKNFSCLRMKYGTFFAPLGADYTTVCRRTIKADVFG